MSKILIKRPPTKIAKCECLHEFQDKTYGKNMRVHNWAPGNKVSNPNRYGCTICCKLKVF